MKFHFLFFINFIGFCMFMLKVNGYIVNINVKDDITGEDEDYCALEKDGGPNGNYNDKTFRLNILETNKSCSFYSKLPINFTQIIFLPLNDNNCKLPISLNSNLSKFIPYAMVGSNGPLNATDTGKIPMIFLPLIYSNDLILKFKNSTRLLMTTTKTSAYDYSLLILWFIAAFCVLNGALLSKREFIIKLYKKSIYVAKNKENEEKEKFFETQYFDDPKKRKKEISSDEHTGIYTRYAEVFASNEIESYVIDQEETNQSTLAGSSINLDQIMDSSKRSSSIIREESSIADHDDDMSQRQIQPVNKPETIFYFFEKDDGVYDDDYDILELESFNLPVIIIGELIFAVCVLLLLYFVYNVFIYFFFVVYVLVCANSLFKLISIGPKQFNIFTCRIRRNKIPFLNKRPQVRMMLLYAMCLTFSIIWFGFRNADWAWILQDILGIALSIYVLSQIHIYSYKYVSLILIVFFLYDVFMVFLSPYLTRGNSIMESVINGGKVYSSVKEEWEDVSFGDLTVFYEKIPILISIPNLSKSRKVCTYITKYPFTSLGLGDIIIPGICVSYSIIFDLASSNNFSIYFLINFLGYVIGLFLAFIGYVFMNSNQPALFYICPLLFIVNIIVSLIRKEFKAMWFGDIIKKYVDVNTGYTKDLTKYRVKKSNAFNILKLTRRKTEDQNIRKILTESQLKSGQTSHRMSTTSSNRFNVNQIKNLNNIPANQKW